MPKYEIPVQTLSEPQTLLRLSAGDPALNPGANVVLARGCWDCAVASFREAGDLLLYQLDTEAGKGLGLRLDEHGYISTIGEYPDGRPPTSGAVDKLRDVAMEAADLLQLPRGPQAANAMAVRLRLAADAIELREYGR